MATDNNRTKTPNDAVKITELPEGSQLLLVDSSGVVLERMEAERFMELLRASIQIGGRNLIQNSKQISTGPNSSNFYHTVISDAFEVKAGDMFTASFGAVELTGSQSQNFQVSIIDRVKNITFARFILGPDAKTATAVVSADCDNAKIILYTGISGSTANKSIKVTNLKLERGNIASDWTPAPEDFMEIEGVIYWLIDYCKSAPSPLSQQTQTTTIQTKER